MKIAATSESRQRVMERSKIWLVTGASQGLGFTAVKYLISKEQRVIAIASESQCFDQNMLANPLLDVIDLPPMQENNVANVAEYLRTKYGTVDTLINNVGLTPALFHSLLPLIRTDGKGQIIDLSLPSERLQLPGYALDAGLPDVENCSEIMRWQAKEQGIRVTVIGPQNPVTIFSTN